MYGLPMIAVRKPRASAQWYRRLLGCETDDVAEDFNRLGSAERTLLLLHSWDAEEHAAWDRTSDARIGNGFVLWLIVEAFDQVYAQARTMEVEILVEPHRNPEDGVREFTLRDPDGYAVAIIEDADRL